MYFFFMIFGTHLNEMPCIWVKTVHVSERVKFKKFNVNLKAVFHSSGCFVLGELTLVFLPHCRT